MSEQVIAVVVSLKLWHCTPDEAIEALRKYGKHNTVMTSNGEVEILDVNLLFPRKADT